MIEPHVTARCEALIRQTIVQRNGLTVVGICGAQGSGKSTLAAHLATRLEQAGIATAVLSLDDLYLTRSERLDLARDVHPLLATRGVPGTHDIALGQAVIAALAAGKEVALPRFDKGADDRAAAIHWPGSLRNTRVLLFEGWCMGAVPQGAAALAEPINDLERSQDRAGIWRTFANRALAGNYQQLFGLLDCLILLAAPGFEVVSHWRAEQECRLRESSSGNAPGLMTDAEVERFVQYYERLTRHILTEMPDRADLTIWLDCRRRSRSTD